MADLKAGTTVGGNTIWSQANLPLLPSGNTITYKGFKIYTENDKPTKAEIGLGNVTNDAQVKKAGDDMTGNLTLTNNASLTLPRRINFVSDNSSAVYTVATRSDNNAVTDPFPSSETRVYSLLVNTKSHTSDPAGGATLAAHLFNQKASGAGSMFIQVFGPPNKTTGASGSVTGQLLMNGENGQLQMTGSGLTIGMQTVVSGTIFGTQMSIKGDSNRNLFFQDAGGNELGLIYADTGKNLYVRTGGGAYATRFASDGTLVLANHLTVPGQATFNGLGVFNNRASVGVNYDSQGINSAILRVETNGDGNGVGDGVTHLGYKDGNGRYNHYFRGTGSTYINTKLGLNVNVPSYYNDVPQGTPAQYFLPTVGQGGKNYLRQFRGGNADTIWHETVQGGVWRLATGSTDAQEELQVSTAGYCRTRQEFQSTAVKGDGGQFRAVAGNYGFIIRNDGGNTYFMLTNYGDPYGGWSSLRPITISNGTGQVSIGTPLVVTHSSGLTVTSTAGDAISWGNAGACLANDGNLKGSRWKSFGGSEWAGDALSWVNNNNVAKSGDTMSGMLTIQANSSALRLNATASNQSVYVLGQRAGVDGFYMGFGGSGTDLTLHNYILDTNINLRASDISFSRTVYGNGDANFNNVYIRSDVTLKRNFKKIENALDKVDKLDGLIYEKKNTPTSTEYESVEAGIIAQSLQEILPEAVVEKEGILNVSASGTIALLVNAIKELKARVEYLESK